MNFSFPLLDNHHQLRCFLEDISCGVHVAILHDTALFPDGQLSTAGHFFAVMIEKKQSGPIHMSSFDSLGRYAYISTEFFSRNFEHLMLTYNDSPLMIQLRIPPEDQRQISEPICYAYALQDAYILSQLTHMGLNEARKRFYEQQYSVRMNDLTLAKRMYEALLIMDSADNFLQKSQSIPKKDNVAGLTVVQATPIDDLQDAVQHQVMGSTYTSSVMKHGLFCVAAAVVAVGGYAAVYNTHRN